MNNVIKRPAVVVCLLAAGFELSGAAAELPLVFKSEDRGADLRKPPMPAFAELPAIAYLPDPFLMADGKRMASREQWTARRSEIKSLLENYDVGTKPGKPSVLNASLDGNTIHITVGEGTNTFDMTATINRPAGALEGPIPVLIGENSPTGSLPAALISSRGIATIAFKGNEVASTGFSGVNYSAGNFAKVYPDGTAGYMIRWAWGVSRLIDALEMLPQANLDLSHIAVTGCSFAGKAALYAGAWDERIALTLPQESGGGGTISWRYSDMLEKRDKVEVENLLHAQGGNADFPWYSRALRQFSMTPEKLPVDHHELIALIAPRAVLMIESSRVPRMGAEAARVDALAAREVWTALGVPDRMGVTEEDTPHCQWHAGFTPDVEAYLDKFMLGKADGPSTNILRSKFTDVDRGKWIPWKAPELGGSPDSAQLLIDDIAKGLDARVVAALSQINGTDRRLLALRSYLRSRSTLVQRWSWTAEQVDAFAQSPEHHEIQNEIVRVRQAFVAANPGFDLWVNPEVRSLDTQLTTWNNNASVSRAAANLQVAFRKWLESGTVKSMSPAARQKAAEQFLSSYGPKPTPTLAAPGLSAHGQMRAIDFQVQKGGKSIAGAQSARIDTDWDAAGWTEKLKAAVHAGSDRFSGPLASPREPWHYTYLPASP